MACQASEVKLLSIDLYGAANCAVPPCACSEVKLYVSTAINPMDL